MNLYSISKFRYLFMFVGIFTALLFTSCSEDEQDPSLVVEVSNIDVPAEGTSSKITIKSNSEWTISSVESWVTASPASGKGDAEVTVTIAENKSVSNARETKITVMVDEALFHDIKISQAASVPYVTVSQDVIEVPVTGGTYEVTVKSNIEWKSGGGGLNYISYNPKSGTGETKVTIVVAENEGAAREGSISFYQEENPSLKASVKIKQATLAPALSKAGNYVQDAVHNMPGDLSGYTEFGVLSYKIVVPANTTLTVTDKASSSNIWWVLYNDESKVGSWEYPKDADGTLVYDVVAGTYYVLGLLNYWYDEIKGQESSIQYDLEILCKGATVTPYTF